MYRLIGKKVRNEQLGDGIITNAEDTKNGIIITVKFPKEELAQAIMKLPQKYMDTLLLYYYQDMNQEEVAQALNTSPSTISYRLKHACEKLRDILERGQEHER